MSASHQISGREANRSASGRQTPSNRDTILDPNDRDTALDPSRASFSFHGRRDEEGRLYDSPEAVQTRPKPTPRTEVKESDLEGASFPRGGRSQRDGRRQDVRPEEHREQPHAAPSATNSQRQNKEPRKERPTGNSPSEKVVVQPPGPLLSATELVKISADNDQLLNAFEWVRVGKDGLDKAYGALLSTGVSSPRNYFRETIRWLFTGFGLFDSQRQANNDVNRAIQNLKKTLDATIPLPSGENTPPGAATTISIKDCQLALRSQFDNRTFRLKPDTPNLLKSIAIPAGKTHVPFESLKSQIEKRAQEAGSGFRITRLSEDRLVLHRRTPTGKWENVELSWRGETKVNVVQAGKAVGHLFNGDALALAERFFNNKSVRLHRTKTEDDSLWKIV